MKRLSDMTARRLAWVVPVAYVLLLAATVMLLASSPLRNHDSDTALDHLTFYLVVVSIPTTGLFILRRQPRNRIGWLLMGTGLVWAVAGFADSYVRYALFVQPGSLPGPEFAAAVNAVIWVPGLGLMGTFLILLFPDGRLPTPRWRFVGWVSALTVVSLTLVLELTPGMLGVGPAPRLQNPFGLESARPVLGILAAILLLLLPLCILACSVALVLRFRRSRGVERLQLKWLTTAGAVVAVLYAGAMLAPVAWRGLTGSTQQLGWMTLLESISLAAFLLIPASIGTAVLRHRLYDIDVVINRTLVYGALTVTLAAVYAGSVLLLQLALDPLTQDSDLAVAVSTLTVAALFRPARSRIQSVVDRRFYRSRIDAAHTLDGFTSRLRHELDLDALGTDLRTTVDEAMHPTHVSLWIRP